MRIDAYKTEKNLFSSLASVVTRSNQLPNNQLLATLALFNSFISSNTHQPHWCVVCVLVYVYLTVPVPVCVCVPVPVCVCVCVCVCVHLQFAVVPALPPESR